MTTHKLVSAAVRRLFREYRGTNFTINLPSRALSDIGKSNSTNVFGQAVGNIATKYPKGVTTITGEIGDRFISTTAVMKNGDNVVGEFSFNADANILDAIREAFSWKKIKAYEVNKTVSDKFIKRNVVKTNSGENLDIDSLRKIKLYEPPSQNLATKTASKELKDFNPENVKNVFKG